MKPLDKLGSMAKLDHEKSDDGEEEMSESQDAAQDVLDAFKAGDAKALDLALQRHSACCDDDSGYVSEDEE